MSKTEHTIMLILFFIGFVLACVGEYFEYFKAVR